MCFTSVRYAQCYIQISHEYPLISGTTSDQRIMLRFCCDPTDGFGQGQGCNSILTCAVARCDTLVFLASRSIGRELSRAFVIFCELSGLKCPEPEWRKLKWAQDEMRSCVRPRLQHSGQESVRNMCLTMADSINCKSQELGLNTAEQSLVSFLRNLTSSLCTEESFANHCGSFCVSAPPSEIPKMVYEFIQAKSWSWGLPTSCYPATPKHVSTYHIVSSTLEPLVCSG